MENLVIEKSVAFMSQDYSEASQIEKLIINITPTDVDNIRKAMSILKENKFMESINLSLNGYVENVDDLGDEVDWKSDVERFIVYDNSVYYYAQNKWSAGDQIESDCIELSELGIKLTV